MIELLEILLTVIGSSAIISAALPPKVKQYLPVIGSVIEVLGANIGNAKNKHD